MLSVLQKVRDILRLCVLFGVHLKNKEVKYQRIYNQNVLYLQTQQWSERPCVSLCMQTHCHQQGSIFVLRTFSFPTSQEFKWQMRLSAHKSKKVDFNQQHNQSLLQNNVIELPIILHTTAASRSLEESSSVH